MFEDWEWHWLDIFKNRLVLNLLVVILFLGLLTFITIRFGSEITDLAKEPDQFRTVILSYDYFGVLIFVAIQVLQVIVAAIPGEVIQIAGGYIYGTLYGSLYLIIGVIMGGIIAFYCARLLGFPLMKKLIPHDKFTKLNQVMQNKKADLAIFMLFLLPGLPKDFLVYIGGLTPIKVTRFIFISTVARLPALIVSAHIGDNLQEKKYSSVLILSAAVVILFISGWIYREKLIETIHRLTHSKTDQD